MRFWHKISHIGLENKSPDEVLLYYRPTVLLNRMLVIIILSMILFIPFELFSNGIEMLWLVCVEMLIVSFGLVLNYYQKFNLAKYGFLGICIVLLTPSVLLVPPGSANESLFIPSSIVGLLLLDKKTGLLYGAFVFVYLWFLTTIRTYIPPVYQFPVEVLHGIIPVFVSMSMGIVFFVIMYFKSMNDEFLQMISNQNEVLAQQKEEILAQSEEINQQNLELIDKNQQITNSILYAKRIQHAMIPDEKVFHATFPNSFIFFKPKDIVSGDFYWFREIYIDGQKNLFLACVDCTGHGVPGAFVSMIGNELLTKIIFEKEMYSPELILDELHANVKKTLNQDQVDSQDGMDIILVRIDFENQVISYAGAMNPLYIFQDQEPMIIAADKQNIGGKSYHAPFQLKKIPLKKDTTLFLATDGFQDQFGGSQKRKFMVKNFREMLFNHAKLNPEAQLNNIEQTFNHWKQNREQMDDILIIGVRLKK